MGEINKRERIVFKPEVGERVMVKDGKKYRMVEEVIGKDQHVKRVIFEAYDEQDWKKRVDRLADYLINKSHIGIKDVLKSVLNSVDMKTLERLEKKMNQRVKVKVKHGCLALTMGNANIQIVE